MRATIMTFGGILVPGTAVAHPGHLAAAGGHDHWIALGAIGLAAGLGLWGILKDRKAGAEAARDQDADCAPDADEGATA